MKVIAGDTRMEDLSKRVLAGDPEALKLANRLGLEADVKWYKRVQPDRRKQNDSEAAAANPPPRGEAAEAATGELAQRRHRERPPRPRPRREPPEGDQARRREYGRERPRPPQRDRRVMDPVIAMLIVLVAVGCIATAGGPRRPA
jgi:hypothetical protein